MTNIDSTSDMPDFPRWMVASDNGKVVTIRSPTDHQDGLVTCWTKDAAQVIARKTSGGIVVEDTPEMFVEACRAAFKMGVPYLYLGSRLGEGVDFRRVLLAVGPRGSWAFDEQHESSNDLHYNLAFPR